MRYLSICSGIEAASVAWHPLGWTPVGFAEIDPFASAVLAHRFPGVPNFGDVNLHETWPIQPNSVDLLVAGTPCQSFSLAGLRRGLADPRGNLALVYLSIIDRLKPRYTVWENVGGVLSSNGGRDFGTLLGGMAELGYGFCYRVLDSQFVRVESHPFAVPQRRRRVFVVGCSGGDWRRAAEILSIGESVRGDPPSRRKAWQGSSRRHPSRAEDNVDAIEVTGNSPGVRGFSSEPTTTIVDTTNITHKDNRSRPKPGDPCHTLAGKSHAPLAIIDTYNQTVRPDGASHTMMSRGDTSGGNSHLVPVVAIRESGMGWWQQDEVSGTIDAHVGQSGTGALRPAVIFQGESVACLSVKDYGADVMRNVAPTLRAMNSTTGHINGGGQLGIVMQASEATPECSICGSAPFPGGDQCEHCRRTSALIRASFGSEHSHQSELPGSDERRDEPKALCEGAHGLTTLSVATTLASGGGKPGQGYQAVLEYGLIIRRLTPRECERLQGFPDDWTLVPFGKNGRQARDSKRYKAIGNSMSTNVMSWIGERIQAVDLATRQRPDKDLR